MILLCDFGITDEDIRFMLEEINDLVDITEEEITEKIQILKMIECNEKQIRNIIVSNPNYLCRSNKDIINLINILTKLQIENLNLLFDSNPYFFNKDYYEIEHYIKSRLEIGELLEDIIEGIEDNPYIIDEY